MDGLKSTENSGAVTFVRTSDVSHGVPDMKSAPADFRELMLDIAKNGSPFRCE